MPDPKSEPIDSKSAVATASPEPVVKPSEEPKGIPSKTVYTEEQLRQAVSNALSIQGGTLGRERDTLKSQLETANANLKQYQDKTTELQNAHDALKNDIELLGEDDTDQAGKLAQRLKELDSVIKKAKDKEVAAENRVKEVEAEREPYAELVNFSLGETLERSIYTVAMEYQGSNSDTLMELCEQMGIKGEKDVEGLKAKIRKTADILWTKKGKSQESGGRPFIPDSCVTNGGGVSFDSMTPAQRREEVARRLRK